MRYRFKKEISFRKYKTKDRRGRHTKAERLAKLRAARRTIVPFLCRQCDSELDVNIRTVEGDAIVCTNCGLVDNNTCFDYEPPLYTAPPRSPLYRHRNYFAEKLLQSRNKEPRISDKELDILSTVFDIFRDECPEVWAEKNFTKRHMGKICRVIKSVYPKSPFCRRIERWYQYRVYLCGAASSEMDFFTSSHLRVLFDSYVHYFLVYLQENGNGRKNITQLDLVVLVLLYNLDKAKLVKYGWYFMNHNIVNQTPSIERDLQIIRAVCDLTNSRILSDKKAHDITTICYVWFRKNGGLVVPSINELLEALLGTPLGRMQYANYRISTPACLQFFLQEVVENPTLG